MDGLAILLSSECFTASIMRPVFINHLAAGICPMKCQAFFFVSLTGLKP